MWITISGGSNGLGFNMVHFYSTFVPVLSDLGE